MNGGKQGGWRGRWGKKTKERRGKDKVSKEIGEGEGGSRKETVGPTVWLVSSSNYLEEGKDSISRDGAQAEAERVFWETGNADEAPTPPAIFSRGDGGASSREADRKCVAGGLISGWAVTEASREKAIVCVCVCNRQKH